MHDSVNGIDVVLQQLIDFLNKHKYQVVSLEELTGKKAYA
jgi:hypothetical protein